MPVALKGAAELRTALAQYAPDLSKETQKQLGKALRPIVAKARGYLPADSQVLTNWTSADASYETTNYRAFPKYSQAEARKGVRYSTRPTKPNRQGWSSLVSIKNTSAGGAIYETAGRKNPQGAPRFTPSRFTPATYRETGKGFNKSLNPNAGKQFIDNLNTTGKLVNAREAGKVGRGTRKMTGRVIFRAWAEDNGKALQAVITALDVAKNRFNDRTNVNG